MDTHRDTFRSQQPRGYTLPELLVSIAVFGILTTMLIANFHRGSLADDLRVSSQTFAENLRTVQNLAMIGRSVLVGANTKVPPGGFGVSLPWISSKTYTLFADTAIPQGTGCIMSDANNPNFQYDAGLGCDQTVDAGNVQFRPNIVIDAIKIDATQWVFGNGTWSPWGSSDPNNAIDIAFQPPKPIPVADGLVGKTIQIELRHLQTNQYRTITIIGPSGQISERFGRIQ
ncbi:MAG: type II secretion system protein [bacterium]